MIYTFMHASKFGILLLKMSNMCNENRSRMHDGCGSLNGFFDDLYVNAKYICLIEGQMDGQ